MSSIVNQAPNLEVHEVPDGYIIYQGDRDRVHYLNRTAAIIFEFCSGSQPMDEIVTRVAKAFDLGSAAFDEIREGLDSLLKEGLVLSTSK